LDIGYPGWIIGVGQTVSDKRALKILFDTYWIRGGWRRERATDPQDLDYAKRAGVMFDSVQVDHDDVIRRVDGVRKSVDPKRVVDAFVSSLSTRRLDLRSALGSYAVFRKMPVHPARIVDRTCVVCGMYEPSKDLQDISILNFERLKFGGVRHDQPLYAAMDLELFGREGDVHPKKADVDAFHSILASIREAPSDTTAANLQARFPPSLRSNKAERDVIVAILGFCGILATGSHSSYRSRFVPPSERAVPDRRFVDMSYPACWWRGSDGLDKSALQEFFGHVL
jgi:hypothetical protein